MYLTNHGYGITYGRNSVPVCGGRQLLMNETRQCLGSSLTVDDNVWLAQQSDEFVQELAGLASNCSAEDKTKLSRTIELSRTLEENPNLVLDVPCWQLDQWENLAKYQLQSSVISKISDLQDQNPSNTPNWDIQVPKYLRGEIELNTLACD